MSDEAPTILSIEDDPGDAELLRRNLERIYGRNFRFVHARNAEEAQRELGGRHVDVTFLDYRLGAQTGLDLLRRIRSSGDLRPLVVLTGQGDEYVAASLAKEGADDYLGKRDLSPETLQQAITEARSRYQRRKTAAEFERQRRLFTELICQAHVELERKSRLDPLTKLLNRAAWAELVEAEHARARRYDRDYCILMIDVDHFKKLNDTLGHPQGDVCLQNLARCLLENCRAADQPGRYGGEEFVVLAPETDLYGGQVLAEQLRRSVWNQNIPHPASPVADRVTVSVGVAAGPEEHWEEVLNRADQALYEAKRAGRNRVESPRD